MKKYPGQTADEINFACAKPLSEIKPKQVIIIAGTNDISSGFRDKNLDEQKIVRYILSIAAKAKYYGAEKVCISSILERRGYKYLSAITRINNELYMSCLSKGYTFLDHSHIQLSCHIGRDGIHPNDEGLCILQMNILKCMLTFNPYLCDFLEQYENNL